VPNNGSGAGADNVNEGSVRFGTCKGGRGHSAHLAQVGVFCVGSTRMHLVSRIDLQRSAAQPLPRTAADGARQQVRKITLRCDFL
jgi:hypothetical protein